MIDQDEAKLAPRWARIDPKGKQDVSNADGKGRNGHVWPGGVRRL